MIKRHRADHRDSVPTNPAHEARNAGLFIGIVSAAAIGILNAAQHSVARGVLAGVGAHASGGGQDSNGTPWPGSP